MPLKRTVVTRVEPDSPGFYFYRPPLDKETYHDPVTQGWTIALVVLDSEQNLRAKLLGSTDSANAPYNHLSELDGEWGNECPIPKAAHKSQTVSSILPKEGSPRSGHRRPAIKTPEQSVIAPQQLAKFLYWISERHSIYLRRHAHTRPRKGPTSDNAQSLIDRGQFALDTTLENGSYTFSKNPKPWTQDPILQSTFFCNPFRELDKTTQWFRENVREPLRNDPAVIMATIIFRWFNFIPTGEVLLSTYGSHSAVPKGRPVPKSRKQPQLGLFTDWNSSTALEILKPLKKVFTGAHVVASGTQLADTGPREGGGSPKVRSICDHIDRLWEKREDIAAYLTPSLTKHPKGETDLQETLQSAHAYLRTFPAIGNFQAYEIVTDLRHTYVLENAPDILTWANAGPGAKRGLNRIFGRPIGFQSPSHPWCQEMQLLLKVAQVEICQPPPKLTTLVDLVKDFGLSLKQNEAVLAGLESPKYSRLPKGHPPFELREVEHSLCEFDKYMRVASPSTDEYSADSNPKQSKRKYQGTP